MRVRECWVSGNEAAEIVSKNSGHTILPAYIRTLATQGKITSRAKNGREKEYLRIDVETIRVQGKGKNRPASAGPTERQRREAKKQEDQPAA